MFLQISNFKKGKIMNNKIIVALILFSATWCSVIYASNVFNYDVETLYIQGPRGDLVIKDDLIHNDGFLRYTTDSNNRVGLGSTEKSVLFDVRQDTTTIYLPKNKVVKKIIDLKRGSIDINGGAGDVVATMDNGSIDLSPTVWGATNITLSRGDVRLERLSEESNVSLDLCVKEHTLINNLILHTGLFITHVWWWRWWAHGKETFGDKSKLVKVWAKEGCITLSKY